MKEQDPGAIISRFSRSFIRFGTFEMFYHREEKENLRKLADYCLSTYFTYIQYDESRDSDISKIEVAISSYDTQDTNTSEEVTEVITVKLNKYARLFQNIVRNTAIMIGTPLLTNSPLASHWFLSWSFEH